MSFKSEFRLQKFGFVDTDVKEASLVKFLAIPGLFLVVCRCIVTVYLIVVLALSIIPYDNVRWLLYLSHWNVLIYTMYYFFVTILSGYHWFVQKRANKVTPEDFIQGKQNSTSEVDATVLQSTADFEQARPERPTRQKPKSKILKSFEIMTWLLLETSLDFLLLSS